MVRPYEVLSFTSYLKVTITAPSSPTPLSEDPDSLPDDIDVVATAIITDITGHTAIAPALDIFDSLLVAGTEKSNLGNLVWIVGVTMLDEIDKIATTPFGKVDPTAVARASLVINGDASKSGTWI